MIADEPSIAPQASEGASASSTAPAPAPAAAIPPRSPRLISASSTYSAYVRGDGLLFVCGGGEEELSPGLDISAARGQIGAGDLPPAEKVYNLQSLGLGVEHGPCIPRPTPLTSLSVSVREVSAGPRHMLLVSTSGDVFSCGRGGSGQLGHGDELNRSSPCRITTFRSRHKDFRATQVSAGAEHSLVVSDPLGRCYAFGSGFDGRHGHGDVQHVWRPRALANLADARKDGGEDFWSHVIVDASAGASHSLAVSNAGRLFAWGRGSHGQLGVGLIKSESYTRRTPSLCDLPEGTRVTRASAGDCYSLACTDDGRVFAFGLGAAFRLGMSANGQPDSSDRHVPTLVTALSSLRVVCVETAHDHSVVLTDSGRVCTFGAPYRGKLGHGGSFSRPSTKEMKAYVGALHSFFPRLDMAGSTLMSPSPFLEATGAGAGCAGTRGAARGACTGGGTREGKLSSHLSSEGVIDLFALGDPTESSTFQLHGVETKPYAIGYGHGPLTQGTSVRAVKAFDSMIEGKVEVRVVEIAAGASHTLVRLSNDERWAFGSNEFGQLGLPWMEKDQGDKSLPTKLDEVVSSKTPWRVCEREDASV